jgi:hypothetical protein
MSATNFIVTWTGTGQDGAGPFARLFDASGAAITGDFGSIRRPSRAPPSIPTSR